jgi:hypothetical protein
MQGLRACIMRVQADNNPCNISSTSYAWIDPSGRVFFLGGKVNTHVSFAWARKHPDTKFVEKRHWEEAMGLADEMLKEGWVRVVNARSLEFNGRKVARKAIQAAIEVPIQCALDSNIDIEKFRVYYDDGSGGMDKMPLPDFIDLHGSREQSERLFEGLMARRVAARHLRRANARLSM